MFCCIDSSEITKKMCFTIFSLVKWDASIAILDIDVIFGFTNVFILLFFLTVGLLFGFGWFCWQNNRKNLKWHWFSVYWYLFGLFYVGNNDVNTHERMALKLRRFIINDALMFVNFYDNYQGFFLKKLYHCISSEK